MATTHPLETNPILARIADLKGASSRLGGIFDYDTKPERLEEVSRELENPNVWDNPQRAQELGNERAPLDTHRQRHPHADRRPRPTPANCWNWPPPTTTKALPTR